jgi:hypothetical protein
MTIYINEIVKMNIYVYINKTVKLNIYVFPFLLLTRRCSMDSFVSILGKIDSGTRIHPERLRRRVKDKRRLNTLHQTKPVVAGGVGRSHSLPTGKI